MVPQDSSVDLLAQAILAQAEAEAKKIREDAEATAQRINSEAEQEAATQRERAAMAEAARAERENASTLAAAHLKARRRILEAREELIDRVFAEATTRLESFRTDSLYPRILINLVDEAISALEGDSFTVSVMPEDYDMAARALNSTSLRGKRTEVHADEQIRGGGCIVRQADGRSFYDNTFASIIQRHHLRLRTMVAEVLWGKGRRWDEV